MPIQRPNAGGVNPAVAPTVVPSQAVTTEITSIEPVQQYDIVQDKEQLIQSMDMQKIDQLTSTINVSDMSTIVSFGSEAADRKSVV